MSAKQYAQWCNVVNSSLGSFLSDLEPVFCLNGKAVEQIAFEYDNGVYTGWNVR